MLPWWRCMQMKIQHYKGNKDEGIIRNNTKGDYADGCTLVAGSKLLKGANASTYCAHLYGNIYSYRNLLARAYNFPVAFSTSHA